jgi:hypothetical protein
MRVIRLCMLMGALMLVAESQAFEGDVHFGLTEWLAIQAGFDQDAAAQIATGDGRVDSGDMQFLELGLVNACLAEDERGARLTAEHHYPNAGKIPSAPEARPVAAGSEAAKRAAVAVMRTNPNQSQFTLFMLGVSLHELQDSWSHQGIADVPVPAPGLISCDPGRSWGHPKSRGGWNSHKADLTMYWESDTVAMAQASYEILQHYPALAGVKRTPRAWPELVPAVEQFAKASTKAEKQAWFANHGVGDASFLEGTSLQDGAHPFTLKWGGRKLPPLPSPESRQHFVDADLLQFYNRFIQQWMAARDARDFEALAAEFSSGEAPRRGIRSPALLDLASRLKGWRLRDHGRVAEILHSQKPLTARERAALDSAGRQPDAYAVYPTVADAFFPFLPRTNDVSPLLPFWVSSWTRAGATQAVAVTKLRHVPYDVIEVAAEKTAAGRWHVTSIGATIEH